ncbi:MAG: SDR family NAD(P)-dependent oxidoreductase [Sphingobacteriaceae bacterium]|nr:SDR family NAD(P)-dependent oxidoreductase [Sphingobacteriaceae bacterium]
MGDKFKNKVVLITGSSAGLGKVTALEFCAKGAKVILNGRNENKLKKAQNDFKMLGFEANYFVANCSIYEDCCKLTNFVLDTFGKIDIVIANASYSMNAGFEDSSPHVFKETIDSNIYSVIMPLFTFLPHLKKTSGSFIIISSVAALHGLPTASAYCVGKMALTSLYQSISAELSMYDLHLGIIYLGFIENDKNKTTFNGTGMQVAVPNRNKFLQQPQKKVAGSIIKMVQFRRSKMILGITGKFMFFLTHYFPGLVLWIAKKNQQKIGIKKQNEVVLRNQ